MQIHAIIWQVKGDSDNNVFRWECACGTVQSKDTLCEKHSDTRQLLEKHLDEHRAEKNEEYTILTAQRRHLSKY